VLHPLESFDFNNLKLVENSVHYTEIKGNCSSVYTYMCMNIEFYYLNMHYLPERSYILCYLGIIAGIHACRKRFQKQVKYLVSFRLKFLI